MNREERKDRREGLEDLKDGYIDIARWKRMLERSKVYLRGRISKLHQQQNELSAERDRFEKEHDEEVDRLVAEFGEFKEVVRMSTGEAFKVPTRDIIEKGIREQDLDQYPRWED